MENPISKTSLLNLINALSIDGFSLSDRDYLINFLQNRTERIPPTRDMMQIRRGYIADMPTLSQGELGFTLDTKELFIGGLNGNVKLGGSDGNIDVIFGGTF